MKFAKLLLVLFFGFIFAEESLKVLDHKAQWITTQLYGNNVMHISAARTHAIKTLIKNLLSATPYQLSLITKNVTEKINQEKNSLEKNITTLEHEQKPILPKLFFDRYVLEQYITHLQAFQNSLDQQLSLYEKIQAFFVDAYQQTKYLLGGLLSSKSKNDTFIKTVSKELVKYSNFERTSILPDYQILSNFLHHATHAKLPSIMYFWNTNEVRNGLRLRAKLLMPEVQVQFLQEIAVIALQSILLGGSSMYNSFIDELDQKKFEEYTQQQQAIQASFSEFIRTVKSDQNALRKTMSEAFLTKAKALSDQYKKTNQALNEETIYLLQAINLNPPISHNLEYPAIWSDQAFANSIMNTPKGNTWYNVFQVPYSDWEYNSDNNSFWQNGLSNFDKTANITANASSSPEQDHIFMEYSSNKADYDIVVECRLINAKYPFFAGIMFNKARWISAVPERYYQCRLLGLYGTNDTNNAHQITLCFAQQYTTKTTDEKKSTIVTPLQQITTDAKTNLLQLSKDYSALLIKEPLRFLFTITTKPTQVDITVTYKGQKETVILQKTVDDLNDPYLAIFGGIGFMAAGCQAEFTLIKPENLVYTPAQIKEFKAAQ